MSNWENLDDLIERVPDPYNLEEMVVGQFACLHFISILKNLDKVIVLMLMAGFTQREASEVLCVDESYISQRLKEVRGLSKVILNIKL